MAFVIKFDLIYPYIDAELRNTEDVQVLMKIMRRDIRKLITSLRIRYPENFIDETKKVILGKFSSVTFTHTEEKHHYRDNETSTVHEYMQMLVTMKFEKKHYKLVGLVLPDVKTKPVPAYKDTMLLAYDPSDDLASYFRWRKNSGLPIIYNRPISEEKVSDDGEA